MVWCQCALKSRWLQLVLGCSQPGCPAVPSAQTDGTLLGPAGRHVRRLSPQPGRLVWLQAPAGVFSGVVRIQVAAVGTRVLPAQLPGRAVGTDRWDAAGSGRPACPPAIPAARSACLVASPSRGKSYLVRNLKVGDSGTPSPAARPCRRHSREKTRPEPGFLRNHGLAMRVSPYLNLATPEYFPCRRRLRPTGRCWVRSAGMPAGYPRSPIGWFGQLQFNKLLSCY